MVQPIVKITGGREIHEALKEIGGTAPKNVFMKGLRAGAKVVRVDARRRAPALSGRLRKAITSIDRRGTRDEARVSVGIKSGAAPHAQLIHMGTRPRFWKQGKSTGRVKAIPFLKMAFDNNRQRILSEMIRRMRVAIFEELKKSIKQHRKIARL